MKQQSKVTVAIRSSLLLAVAMVFALAFWSPVQAQKAEPAVETTKMDEKMMEHCKEMKEQKQKMTEEMHAQNVQLSEHVAEMNSAPQEKKVDAIAAVVTKMVEERIAMSARMEKMQEEKMAHMMRHMQKDKESMAQCPMMKDMSEKSAKTHE